MTSNPYQLTLPDSDQVLAIRRNPEQRRQFGVLVGISRQLMDHKGKPFAAVTFHGKPSNQPSNTFLDGVVAACTAQHWFARWRMDEGTGHHSLYASLEPLPEDAALAGIKGEPVD